MSELEQDVQSQESQEAQAPAEQAPASLSLQDLANLKQIIDIAAERGTFKAGEMAGIGFAYNKLVAFLSAVASQQQAQQAEEQAEA